METLVAIDPGTTESGVLILSGASLSPIFAGILANDQIIADLIPRQAGGMAPKRLVLEKVESYGMAIGQEVIETIWWSGRFVQAWVDHTGWPWTDIPRREIKLSLCGTTCAKDTNVRTALIDLFGGKAVAIGRKRAPGPLYGVKAHAWAALAVAITYFQKVIPQLQIVGTQNGRRAAERERT